MTKLLLENGVDIHACNDAALRYAAESGQLEITKLLLENGADIHACNDAALCYAAEFGYLEVTKLLLENGADIHARDDMALCYAAERGRLEVVKLLLENGANSYKIDESRLREVKPNNCADILALVQQYKDKSAEKPIAKIRYIVSPTFTDEMSFANPEEFKSEFINAIDTYGANNVKAEVLSDSPELKQFVEKTVIDEFGLEPDEPDKPTPSGASEIVHTEQTPIENKSQLKSPPKRSIREMLKAAKEKCSIINAAKVSPEKSSRDINITR